MWLQNLYKTEKTEKTEKKKKNWNLFFGSKKAFDFLICFDKQLETWKKKPIFSKMVQPPCYPQWINPQ